MNKRRFNSINPEPKQGDMKEISLHLQKDSKTNEISTKSFSLLTLPLKSLLESCSLGNLLWFLFLISIHFTPTIKETSLKLSIILPFSIIFLASLIRNSMALRNQDIHDSIFNNREYAVFTDPAFTLKPSKNIVVGDLLLIKDDQQVPADCLLLANSNENNEIQSKNFDSGQRFELEKKKAVKETQAYITEDGMGLADVKKHLEYVKVLQPNPFYDKVACMIKVKSNPRVVYTDQQHFLPSGSMVLECEWALMLVVYAGNDTKKWMNYKPNNLKKNSKVDQMIDFSLILNAILAVFYILITCFFAAFYSGYKFQDSSTEHTLYTIVLFGNMNCVSLHVCLLVFELVVSFCFNLGHPMASIINEKILEDLNNVEFIFADKKGVLTDEGIEVQTIMFPNEIHTNKGVSLEQNNSPNESFNSEGQVKSPIGGFSSLATEIQSEVIEENKILFGAALILCNSYTSKESHLPTNDLDSALLQLAESLGFKLLRKEGKKFEIQLNSALLTFSIVWTFETKPSSRIIKSTIKNHSSGEVFLVYKLPLDQVDSSELVEDFNLTEETCSSEFFALQKLVFLFKPLTKLQVKRITKEFNQVLQGRVNRKQRRSEVFDVYKTEMKVLAVLGYENRISEEVVKTCQEITATGIKFFITGNFNPESGIASGLRLKLIDENSAIVRFDCCKTPGEALQVINDSLGEELSKGNDGVNKYTENADLEYHSSSTLRFRSTKPDKRKRFLSELGLDNASLDLNTLLNKDLNFAVVINAKVVKLAYQSRELMKKLVVLLFTARCTFACRLGPESKKKLLEIVRRNFQFRPVVMAIGKYHDSFKMMSEASVCVKVTNNFTQDWSFTQVFLANFVDISSLLLGFGKICYAKIQVIVVLSLFRAAFEGTLMFFYQIFSVFSAEPLVNYDLLVLFDLFLSAFYVFCLSFTLKGEGFTRILALLSHSLLNSRQRFFILAAWGLLGVMQGVLLCFFVIYGVGSVTNEAGMTENNETTGFTTFILMNLVFYMQGFMLSTNLVRVTLCCLTSLSLLIMVLGIASTGRTSYSFLSTSSFLKNSSIWPLLILYPFISLLFSSIFIRFSTSFMKASSSRSSQYTELESVFSDTASWKGVQEHSDFEIDKKLLVFRDSYRENEYIKSLYKKSRFYLQGLLILIFILALINNVFIEVGLQGFLNLGRNTVIVTVFSFVFLLASFYYVKETNFFIFELTVVLLILAFSISQTFVDPSSTTFQRYPLFAGLFSLIICTGWKWSVVKFIIIFIASIPVVIYETYVLDSDSVAVFISFWLIIIPFQLVLLLIVNYSQEKNRRNEFTYIKKAEIEVEKSSTILSYLLPDFVRKRVKDGARYIAEDKGTVSVVFCDIYEFDRIMESYSPQELTFLLNDIFGRIDMICDNFGVAKIETVGKTYLACAGLKDSEVGVDPIILSSSHARRAVEMALAVIKESEKIKLKDGSHLKFKIGVNSGPVTAGVVGFHKPQFSLVGDTVNTSSRMASTLTEPNAVQISMMTFEMLESTKGLNFVDCIREVKGKGLMGTKIVSMVELRYQDSSSDELSSGMTNKRMSFLSYMSSPTIPHHQNRTNEILQSSIRPHRASLLMNLGVESAQELVKKQTEQKVNTIFNLFCRESQAEKDFRLNYIQDISKSQKVGLIIAISCNFCLMIAELIYVLLKLKHGKVGRLVIVLIWQLLMIVAFFLSKKHSQKIKFTFFLSSIYTLSFVAIFTETRLSESAELIDYIYYFYTFIMLNFFTGNLFAKNIYFNLVFISLWLADTFIFTLSLPHISYIFTILGIVLFTVFTDEKRMRENTVLKNAAEKEISKTQQLLTQMMPPNALTNLEKGNQVMDRLNQVTLMFADIVGFTAWSSTRSPFEVVNMLSELFTRFDKMSVENNVYKVHTIGDCYVAMGYVNDNIRNPAKEAVNVIKFASGLIELIKETNEQCGIELGMRIGIHTGEITGGITGTKIVRYDVYGEDVQIANKMESNGMSGRVAVSETTKVLIDSYMPQMFLFTEGKEVKCAKDSGSIKLYFYEGQSGE